MELVAESAALLCQTPVQEPWSWWPAVQAAWQRGEHEQVRALLPACHHVNMSNTLDCVSTPQPGHETQHLSPILHGV